jgi:hypothetical protein
MADLQSCQPADNLASRQGDAARREHKRPAYTCILQIIHAEANPRSGVSRRAFVLRAACGGGPEGVALFMNRMRGEFERAMVLTGVSSASNINSSIVSLAA